MTQPKMHCTDTFGDTFTLDFNNQRLAIDIDIRGDGARPSILCMSKAETLALRDRLLEILPLEAKPQLVKAGELSLDTRALPSNIIINATNVYIKGE